MNLRHLCATLVLVAISGTIEAQEPVPIHSFALRARQACLPGVTLRMPEYQQGAPPAGGKTQTVKGKVISRSEVARMIYVAFKSRLDRLAIPLPATSPFSDVSRTNRDFRAIVVLAKLQIVAGNTTGEFHPQENVSRYELAMMLDRLVTALIPNPNGLDPLLSVTIRMPEDVPRDVEAYTAVENMLKLGVALPFTDGYFRGKRPTTDAEVAEALARIKELRKPANAHRRKTHEATPHTG